MKVDANFRRRASAGENVRQLNSVIIAELSKIEGLFFGGLAESRATFDSGVGESAGINLSACLVKGVRGGIFYASRIFEAIKDKGISDDVIKLELDINLIDYLWFSEMVFPEIVKAFGAYRSTIVTNQDQAMDDFDEIVELSREKGMDVNGRDGVFRIQSVNYFDEILCIRAFGIDFKKIIYKLEGQVYLVREVGNGAFFIVKDNPVVGVDTIFQDARIKALLA